MQLSKSEDIISQLIKKDPSITFDGLDCWVKHEHNYNIYIFTIQLDNEAELLKVKDDLRDYLAIYFQSQTLNKDVERWNIYQTFFIKKQINKSLKQQVEQDKLATRKIVCDNIGEELSDETICSKLQKLFFDFQLERQTKSSDSLTNHFSIEESKLMSAIEKVNGDVELLLNELGNE